MYKNVTNVPQRTSETRVQPLWHGTHSAPGSNVSEKPVGVLALAAGKPVGVGGNADREGNAIPEGAGRGCNVDATMLQH